MDTIRLRLFASIARTRSFSRTAERYSMTQSAVSHSIKNMEAELGVRLINRTSHDVSLTAEGEEFLAYASQILDIYSAAENRIQSMAQGHLGSIRVAAQPHASYQLFDCLTRLYSEHPLIQVDIDFLEGAQLARSLQRGTHDFYFAFLAMIPAYSEYSYNVIHRGALELFVNKNIADSIDLNNWSTVERHPFVSIPQTDTAISRHVMLIYKNHGINPRITNYCNRAEAVVLSVDSGLGLAILPGELSRLYQRPNVVTFPIDDEDAEIMTVFAWKKDMKTTACEVFQETVLSIYPKINTV